MILPSGHRVLHFDRIDSTNAEAKRLADQGERGPLWLWADEQTGGRGRLGRPWLSAPGNLYATFLFPCQAKTPALAQLSFVLALAARAAIVRTVPQAAIGIKWPNDLQIEGAKVCGLLCETVSAMPQAVALGCGINVAHAPTGLPYRATALAEHGASIGVAELLAALDDTLAERLAAWNEGEGFAAIRRAWEEAAVGFGLPAEVVMGDRRIRGTFSGLAENGALLLALPGGGVEAIHAGDVRFLAGAMPEPGAA